MGSACCEWEELWNGIEFPSSNTAGMAGISDESMREARREFWRSRYRYAEAPCNL